MADHQDAQMACTSILYSNETQKRLELNSQKQFIENVLLTRKINVMVLTSRE